MYEQQLILYAIVQARETDTGLYPWQKPVEIRVQDFMKAYNITDNSGNVYRYLREAIKTLFDRSVTIYHNLDNTDTPAVTEMRWISRRTYSDDLGYLSFTFAPDVVPYISRLEQEFTQYDLKQVGNFTSSYAVRIFELLKQYELPGKREIEIFTLRKLLQLEDKHKLFADLIKNVIKPSLDQINLHTDYLMTYETYKLGRKVVSLKFKIKSKKPKVDKPRQTAMRFKSEKPKKLIEKTAAVIKQEQVQATGKLPTEEIMFNLKKAVFKDQSIPLPHAEQ